MLLRFAAGYLLLTVGQGIGVVANAVEAQCVTEIQFQW